MKIQSKLMLLLIAVSLIAFTGCKKAPPGATKISGISFYAVTDECDYLSRGANYALRMTGDLEGCLYGFIDEYKCFGDGFYLEKGRELFVGRYKGKTGTFRTTYTFEGKYEGCAENGSPLGLEIIGGCQHPIVEGSGDGVFKGVTGQLNFWDDIKKGNFPYWGHLQF